MFLKIGSKKSWKAKFKVKNQSNLTPNRISSTNLIMKQGVVVALAAFLKAFDIFGYRSAQEMDLI